MKLILALALLLCISNTEAALTRSKSTDDVAALVDTLSKLRDCSFDERHECSKTWERARVLTNEKGYKANKEKHEEAYKLFKQAICGIGESEYSKTYTKLVNGYIEAFCLQSQIDMETLAKFKKSFDIICRYSIWYQCAPIAYHLSLMAKDEQNVAKAIRLHKEVIFWDALHLFVEPYSEELHYALIKEIRKICRLQ
jgi:hypothetical protein